MENTNNTLILQVLLHKACNAHKNVVELVNNKIADLCVCVSKIDQSVTDENNKYPFINNIYLLVYSK